jgi:hypothetical protein
VSPSGMEMRTKKVPRVEPGKAYEVGLGRPTLIDDCHALPVSWITGYRLLDREGVGGEVSPRHDRVSADDPTGGQSRAQDAMRAVRFGDDQQPGSLLVQAMHHSRPMGVALRREASSAAQQGVYQSPAPVSGSRVHHHPCRLVDHEQRLVLVNDADRDVFTGDGPLFHLGDLDPDDFATLRPVARLLAPPIDQHVSLCDQRRGLRAGELSPLGDKQIEADIAVRLDGKLSGVAQV